MFRLDFCPTIGGNHKSNGILILRNINVLKTSENQMAFSNNSYCYDADVDSESEFLSPIYFGLWMLEGLDVQNHPNCRHLATYISNGILILSISILIRFNQVIRWINIL